MTDLKDEFDVFRAIWNGAMIMHTTRWYDNAPFTTSQIFILEYKLILILFSFKNEYVEGVIAGAKAAVVATIATAILTVSHFSHNCLNLKIFTFFFSLFY